MVPLGNWKRLGGLKEVPASLPPQGADGEHTHSSLAGNLGHAMPWQYQYVCLGAPSPCQNHASPPPVSVAHSSQALLPNALPSPLSPPPPPRVLQFCSCRIVNV